MSYAANTWDQDVIAAEATVTERMGFLRRTYVHLGGAVAAFVLLEAVILQTPIGNKLLGLVGTIPYGWLIFMLMFMAASWLANSWANSSTSRTMQYAGLGLYVVAESIIFAPLLTVAMSVDPDIPMAAGVTTLVMFGALTAFIFLTRADFSFLGGFLTLASIGAVGVIAAAVIFQFALGPIFSVVMVVLACGYILYYTSNVLHHYRTTQHVAASLALFASVALLLWYVVQLFMAGND